MRILAILGVLLATLLGTLTAAEKPTSLGDVQAAIDANLKTQEGKNFDQRQGNDFVEKHMGPLRACKQPAGGDWTSFWILMKLGKDGSPEEVLFHPTTKLAACAHDGLMKEKYLAPPRPDYWVGIYFKISH